MATITEKTKPTKKTQAASDPHAYIDGLLKKLGPMTLLTEGEVGLLFGRLASQRLSQWKIDSVAIQPPPDARDRRSRGHGYNLSSVVAAIRNSGEIFAETDTANAIVNGQFDEAINPDRGYSASEIETLFSIPGNKVDHAVSNKQLTSLTPEIREPTIRGDQLLDWVDSAQIETVLTIHAAAVIARRRKFLSANPELPEAQPTIVDDAFNAIMAKEIAEQAEAAKQRNGLLIKYRSIIHRHAKPEDSDAKELAEVCRALGYSREHVQADISALEKIAELDKYATDSFFQKAKIESEAVAAERKALELRHRAEKEAFNSRESKARAALRRSLEVGSEIARIKTERRELFGC